MLYENVKEAVFINRPNRFIAEVEVEGRREKVHVKNTGRCRELLIPGARVVLEPGKTPGRKTACDLIAVEKPGMGWINIDSQAPNKVVLEWLRKASWDLIKPEFTFGSSRIDFYMEKDGERYLMEVKGCTLEIDGEGWFPDAPTQRGTKHLKELTAALKEGFHSIIAFVIQMEGVYSVQANKSTDPEFAAALEEAERAGVKILYLPCRVEADSLEISCDTFKA